MLPILIIEFLNLGYKNFFNKYFKSFFFAIITLTILSQVNLLDYLGNYTLSGGAILKINYLITDIKTGSRLTKGYSIQVAVDISSGELLLASPSILYEKLGLKKL